MKYLLIVLYFLLLLSTTLPSGNKKKVQATEYNDTNRVFIIHVSNIYQYSLNGTYENLSIRQIENGFQN